MLAKWLSTKGLKEVFKNAIEDRLSLFPIALTASFLLSFVVRDEILFLGLSFE